jgi:hypothetical protein
LELLRWGRCNVSKAERAALRNPFASISSSRVSRSAGQTNSSPESPFQSSENSPRREPDIAPVHSRSEHLLRIALNLAAGERRTQVRKLRPEEVEALLDVGDPTKPALAGSNAQQLQVIKRVIEELPARLRAILEAALVGQISRRDLARRFAMSLEDINSEVERALELAQRRLDAMPTRDSEVPGAESSNE